MQRLVYAARWLQRWLELLLRTWLAQILIVPLKSRQTAALIDSWNSLLLPGVRSWCHELIYLVLVRRNRICVYCVVDVGDVLRTIRHLLTQLTICLVLALTLRRLLLTTTPLVILAVGLSHYIALITTICSFLRCLSRLLRRYRRSIDKIVAVRRLLECSIIVKNALCLSLASDLTIS